MAGAFNYSGNSDSCDGVRRDSTVAENVYFTGDKRSPQQGGNNQNTYEPVGEYQSGSADDFEDVPIEGDFPF